MDITIFRSISDISDKMNARLTFTSGAIPSRLQGIALQKAYKFKMELEDSSHKETSRAWTEGCHYNLQVTRWHGF